MHACTHWACMHALGTHARITTYHSPRHRHRHLFHHCPSPPQIPSHVTSASILSATLHLTVANNGHGPGFTVHRVLPSAVASAAPQQKGESRAHHSTALVRRQGTGARAGAGAGAGARASVGASAEALLGAAAAAATSPAHSSGSGSSSCSSSSSSSSSSVTARYSGWRAETVHYETGRGASFAAGDAAGASGPGGVRLGVDADATPHGGGDVARHVGDPVYGEDIIPQV